MNLAQLVPTLDVCQSLRKAGFPQDTMFVWTSRCGETPEILSKSYAEDEWENGGGFVTLCAAPTAEEILNQLPRKMRFDFSLRIYLEPGGCYVGWQDWDGTNVLEKTEEDGLSLIIAAAHAYLWWKKEVAR